MSQVLTNAAEYTVSEIAQAVRRTVEDEFGNVKVRGEISGFRGQHASGHAYFTLKDENAAIDAVIWRTAWLRLLFKPEEGLEVIATGRLTTFPKSSKYQIVIEQLQPAGAGALMVLLEERRRKLAAEGLFAKERKRPLPYLPNVIGVVTSPTGAVIRDILHRLNDRFPRRVLVWPVRVQGETSAAEIVNAISGFNRLADGGPVPRPDLLIVARGGGSIEDLWSFNEESVVRAVVESGIPIISAVGHETDTTLIDYAADLRAPTPTAAAEAAVPVRSELVGYVDDLGQRTRNCLRRSLGNDRDRLRAAAAQLPRPADVLLAAGQRVDHAASNLFAALRHAAQAKSMSFGRVEPRFRPALLDRRVRELATRIADIGRRGATTARRLLERHRAAYAGAAARLSPLSLRAEIRQASTRLSPRAAQLGPAMSRFLRERRERLNSLGQLLESYSYERVLDRGFAVVLDDGGEIVRGPAQVQPGEPLTVRLAEGDLGVSVTGAPARRRRKSRTPSGDSGQETLF
jgi:exodeoxyribonuclease VII large subunit